MLKFEVEIKTLVEGLREVKRALSKKTDMLATSGIKIDANENGVFLTMINGELEMMIQSKLNQEGIVSIDSSGSILIDAQRLIEYVSKAKSDKIKFDEVDEQAVIVRAGRGKMTFVKIPVEHFPKIDASGDATTFNVNSNCLLRGLQSTILFAKTGNQTPVLSGVLFEVKPSAVFLTATDSFRVGQDRVDILVPIKKEARVVVPAELLKKTFTLFSRGETVQVSVYSNWICFEVGAETVYIRLLGGTYPELSHIMQSLTGGKVKLRFLREELADLTSRLLIFKKEDNTTPVMMELTKDSPVVTFKAESPIGKIGEEIDSERLSSEDFKIMFSADFLSDALRSFPKSAEEIEIDLYGTFEKFSIKEVGNDISVRVIVPIHFEE